MLHKATKNLCFWLQGEESVGKLVVFWFNFFFCFFWPVLFVSSVQLNLLFFFVAWGRFRVKQKR